MPDGVKPRRRRSRRSQLRSRSSSPSSEVMAPPASLPTNKSVQFIPLSPQSSQTLRKLHEAQERRSDTDPSSDRSLTQRRGRRQDTDLSSENDVEVLPDRFDTSGRPLGSDDARRWATRGGSFEYRPQERGTQMQGAWGVAGTDAELVNRMAESVGSLLEGKPGILGMLGSVISHLPSSSSGGGGGHGGAREAVEDSRHDSEDEQERPRRTRRRRHRGDDPYFT